MRLFPSVETLISPLKQVLTGGQVMAACQIPTSSKTFDYNYWSDHTSPDANDDGIVDVPYSLDGSGGGYGSSSPNKSSSAHSSPKP